MNLMKVLIAGALLLSLAYATMFGQSPASFDLANLDKLLNEWMTGFDPKLLARFMDALLIQRNHVMAERIGEKLKAAPGKGLFFAIGAGHLIGEEGVLKLLEKQGLKVTRVTEGT